ncbi:MAG: indolepyruvate oxidoreductase subunit beta family protein [Pseudomonadota bacterium]
MNKIAPRPVSLTRDGEDIRVLKLAILAVGGQGGGVLTAWIEDLARAEGYACQATSVAGVAQRTGATIYYVEMAREAEQTPVFDLAPSAGYVDILIAAELMEAGRAIQRGLVTPNRTVLIASSHRALAVSEKTVPGDGIAVSEDVWAAAEVAASRLVIADMERLAVEAGSVISASLFGALAGADVLPFHRQAFEEAIRRGGRGVDRSLRAFAAGFDAARGETVAHETMDAKSEPAAPRGPKRAMADWADLQDRARRLPSPVVEMALAGLRKLVDFQGTDYARAYLNHLAHVVERDDPSRHFELSREAAKHVANAMAYDDVIRVADLKTRPERFDRIRDEMDATSGNLMRVTEYMHPRAEEIVGLLPTRLGQWIEARPGWMRSIDRIFGGGRRLRSDRFVSFVVLYVLGGLRGWRRHTLRHARESAHLDAWLARAMAQVETDYDLAVEIVRCRRLIKGYSDTHARGLSKFDQVMDGAALVVGRSDAANWVARLREAALLDEEGKALKGALRTVRSFTELPDQTR